MENMKISITKYFMKGVFLMASPFRSDQRFIYCNADQIEFYIPQSYFDESRKFAEDLGQTIKVFGLFDVMYAQGNKQETKCMNCPFFIFIYNYDSEVSQVDLPGEGPTLCRVIRYLKGQKIMESQIKEDSDNATIYVKFINSGKVPKTVPYSITPQIWTKNQEIANVNFGIRSETEEMILALTYRNPKNRGEKFSVLYGSDLEVGEHDYVPASIRQICMYASTFTSMTFEDIDSMITTSLNRTRNKGTEAFTPIEDIIKM